MFCQVPDHDSQKINIKILIVFLDLLSWANLSSNAENMNENMHIIKLLE